MRWTLLTSLFTRPRAHPELTAAGIAAGKKLSGALTETTEALNKQHAHIKKSEADDIALLYTYIVSADV